MSKPTSEDHSAATNEALSVTYEIDEACFMRACQALWAHRGIGQFGNYVVAGVVGLCGAILVWLRAIDLVAYLLFSGLLLFIVMTLLRGLIWRRYYRRLDKYRTPITTTIVAGQMQVTLRQVTYPVAWSTFRSYLQTREFLILIGNQRAFSMIPCAAFDSPKLAADFECELAAHLPCMKKRYF